jgi:hypothetical protein
MRNKWKAAFWIYVGFSTPIFILLIYVIFDTSISKTYLLDGIDALDKDIQIIGQSIKGNLSKSQIERVLPKEEIFEKNANEIRLNRLKITFGQNQTVDSLNYLY